MNNEALRTVFRSDRTELSSLVNKIQEYLAPLEPIELVHYLKLNGPTDQNQECFDISLETQDPDLGAATGVPTLNLRQIALWDSEVSCLKKNHFDC
jgi:hypothetical protein